MLTLITGGAASGKSAFAEALITSYELPRIYLATLHPFDQECAEKITRHRLQRQVKGFHTIEQYVDLPQAAVPTGSAVLLDCLSNLLANEMYDQAGHPQTAVESIIAGVQRLNSRAEQVVVVSNEVFSDGVVYDASSQQYLANLGQLNCQIAQDADRVAEIVCGLPIWHKGAGR